MELSCREIDRFQLQKGKFLLRFQLKLMIDQRIGVSFCQDILYRNGGKEHAENTTKSHREENDNYR